MAQFAQHFIAGTWRNDGGSPLPSTNPAYGNIVGSYVPGRADLVQEAASAAKDAFDEGTWAASPRIRAQVLNEFADRLAEARDEIADLVVAENGKPHSEALGETMADISECRYYAGLARNIRGSMQEVMPG